MISPKEWLNSCVSLASRMRFGASQQPRVIVMIDADGIPHRSADAIMQFATELGPVYQVHVFGNFSGRLATQWAAPTRRYRARAHICFSTAAGKNATDIRLV